MEHLAATNSAISRVSVVIPAHNEEQTITRLLDALTGEAEPGELDIVVVCNGCTDQTALLATAYGHGVRVVETPEPSKASALRRGDQASTVFPRVYIDADVVITTASVRDLRDALVEYGLLACAPSRQLDRTGAQAPVRWYYDIWEQLPQVKEGLFGRGAVAVSSEGHQRITNLPPAMSDDLVISEAFAGDERAIVPTACVTVWIPRTVRDLIRRRVRVATGNAQADEGKLRGADSKTSVRTLVGLVRREPVMAARLPVFLLTTAWARTAARRRVRRGDFDTWLRDDSSRSGPAQGPREEVT